MAFALSTFQTALAKGGARPSLFELQITKVPTLENIIELTNIKYYCNVSAIPPLTVTPIERQYFGRTVKIPGDMVFGDLSTTIYASEAGTERSNLERWMDAINGTGSGGMTTALNTANGFGGTVKLLHFPKDKATADHTITFEDCWPTTIGEAAVSYDTASDSMVFDVTWSYNYYDFS